MRVTIFILGFLSIFLLGKIGMTADFPQKPIRMIIPWGAGGGNDVTYRAAVQPAFEKILGQRTIVENIGAGSTKVGTIELMKAKPDGYTLGFTSTESWIGYYYSKTFDTKVWEQLTPIASVTSQPYGYIEVRAESPFKTWADLVKAAKENPGKLTCGAAGSGGMHELIVNDITKAAGIKVKYVPFAGSGGSKTALLGGHVDFRIGFPSDGIPLIRAGQSRGLAVSADKRMEDMPDVPTFKELGVGEVITVTRSIWGPPKLPSDLVDTITKMVEKATKEPEFIKATQNLLEPVHYRSPRDFAVYLQNYDKEYGPKLTEMYK